MVSRPQERGKPSAGYWHGKVRRHAVEMCLSYEGRVLEVGCGEGLFLNQLLEAKPDIEAWGVDSWPEILERAGDLLRGHGVLAARLIKADIKNTPFEGGYFDAVVCVNVFLNLPGLSEVRGVIREMGRVCRRGGRIIVEFPNRLNPLVVFKYKLAKYYDPTFGRHPLTAFFRKDVAAILKEEGFDLLRERCLDFPVKRFAPIILMEAVKN